MSMANYELNLAQRANQFGSSVLSRTFVHVRGVGLARESKLWAAGATDWDALLDLYRRGSVGATYRRLLEAVEQSKAALQAGDAGFFHDRLPSRERWRLYPDFADRAAFIDIETTGLSCEFDKVTVVGLYAGHEFRSFVRGKNLRDFPGAVAHFPLIVSFNGAQFDVPFLRATFPSFRPRAHIDLRFPLRRLGYSGGLKEIERAVGLVRPRGIREVDGFEAVQLWRQHEQGDRQALERLLEYNRHDVMNLVPLATVMLNGMRERFKLTTMPRGR
jgi:hypothetical protein